MNDVERAAAFSDLEAILKGPPTGSWQVHTLARILKTVIADAKPADVGGSSDKSSGKKRNQ